MCSANWRTRQSARSRWYGRSLFENYILRMAWSGRRQDLQDRVLFRRDLPTTPGATALAAALPKANRRKRLPDARQLFAGTLKRTGFTNGAFDASRLPVDANQLRLQPCGAGLSGTQSVVESVIGSLSPSHKGEDICDDLAAGSPMLLRMCRRFPDNGKLFVPPFISDA